MRECVSSDPHSPHYARYWSRATLARVVAVEPEAQATVEAWLQQRRLTTLQEHQFPGGRASGFVRVRAAARLVERAFGVELWTYARPRGELNPSYLPEGAATEHDDSTIVRVSAAEHDRFVAQNALRVGQSGSASATAGVPPALMRHVDFVQGLFDFPLSTLSARPGVSAMPARPPAPLAGGGLA